MGVERCRRVIRDARTDIQGTCKRRLKFKKGNDMEFILVLAIVIVAVWLIKQCKDVEVVFQNPNPPQPTIQDAFNRSMERMTEAARQLDQSYLDGKKCDNHTGKPAYIHVWKHRHLCSDCFDQYVGDTYGL